MFVCGKFTAGLDIEVVHAIVYIQLTVNETNAEWIPKQLRVQTVNRNMNYLQIDFAIDTLESFLTHSIFLSTKVLYNLSLVSVCIMK